MSIEQEKLDQILRKVEEMNASIIKMSDELRSVSASLKSLAVGQITQPPTVHVINSTTKPLSKPLTSPVATSTAPAITESPKYVQ